MNIIKAALKPSQITFLNNEKALYSCDMRSIGESMDHNIPAMWGYENLMPWLLESKYVLVNDQSGIEYAKNNKLIKVSAGSDAKASIYKRYIDSDLSPEVTDLWVAVPHPDADALAELKKFKLNYSYGDFLTKNDKFSQKELLGDLTPVWRKITDFGEIRKILLESKSGYLKRRHGSGGFTVFNVETESDSKKFLELFKENPDDWFFEEFVPGSSFSIQCLKYENSDDINVFGFSEQIIDSGKHFSGSKVRTLESLSARSFEQLSLALQRLSPILKDYEGFFGLDFIITQDEKVSVLEANIRLTAATVPTLLTNQAGGGESQYLEDNKSAVAENSVILTIDRINNTNNILSFFPRNASFGKTISFRLADCSKIDRSLNEESIQELRRIVDGCLSLSTGIAVQNFWPYGWTICFVLEESHCVLSSWFLEKTILVDIFSCNVNVDAHLITKVFKDYFGADKALNLEVTSR